MPHVSPKGGLYVLVGVIRPAGIAAFLWDQPGCMLRSVVSAGLPTWCWFNAIPMCPSHWRARPGSATVLTTASSEPRP